MSDNKPGLGLFVNRKSEGGSNNATAQGPKNVPKRWLYVGLAVMGFSMFATSFFKSEPTPLPAPKKAEGMIDVTPKGAEEKSWQARSQADIAALKEAVVRQADENKRLAEQLKEAQKVQSIKVPALPPGIVPPPAAPGTANNNASVPTLPPAPPAPPASVTGSVPTSSTNKAPSVPSAGMGTPPSGEMGAKQQPIIFKPEASAGSKNPKGLEQVSSRISYKANPYSGMLPAGAFAPIALLNGLDAGTASSNQSNPQPVLLNVQDHATLPGAAKYRLKSCFVLASAYGDLSAERVYFRLAQLSCIDKADRLVMTTPVQGYIVDSDGKLGMRGEVSDRQGAKLGKALLAGFAQGLGSAFGSAQGTVTSSALGAATSITGADALKQSGLTGASTAASQLAQFYLKEAQNIFPVISINAGRTGSMVFTQGVPLTWGQGDSLYQKEVKPD